jgi:serum/glucocorticoid-regulated kinase 2
MGIVFIHFRRKTNLKVVFFSDLKPENILIDYNGHIALCDFGLCKLNMTETETTNTFCGTPEYLAPELLLGHGYTKTVDWWTLGVLLYEMLTGLPPFYDENTNEMYRKILQDELRFPDEVSESARDLLRGVSVMTTQSEFSLFHD